MDAPERIWLYETHENQPLALAFEVPEESERLRAPYIRADIVERMARALRRTRDAVRNIGEGRYSNSHLDMLTADAESTLAAYESTKEE